MVLNFLSKNNLAVKGYPLVAKVEVADPPQEGCCSFPGGAGFPLRFNKASKGEAVVSYRPSAYD